MSRVHCSHKATQESDFQGSAIQTVRDYCGCGPWAWRPIELEAAFTGMQECTPEAGCEATGLILTWF